MVCMIHISMCNVIELFFSVSSFKWWLQVVRSLVVFINRWFFALCNFLRSGGHFVFFITHVYVNGLS